MLLAQRTILPGCQVCSLLLGQAHFREDIDLMLKVTDVIPEVFDMILEVIDSGVQSSDLPTMLLVSGREFLTMETVPGECSFLEPSEKLRQLLGGCHCFGGDSLLSMLINQLYYVCKCKKGGEEKKKAEIGW